MSKRKLTPGYIIFYLLFLPDTWQVLAGLLASYFLTPVVMQPDMKRSAVAMLYFMVATIGYAAMRKPAQAITRALKKRILGDRLASK